jgi:hypothetical protein
MKTNGINICNKVIMSKATNVLRNFVLMIYFIVIRWSHKYVVLDCPTEMAKEIVVSHVRDVALGKRTYHYLLSGLVSAAP